MIGELTVEVVVKRRSILGTLRRVPAVFVGHYRTARRGGNGRIVSAYAAWLMTQLLITFK